MRFRITVLVIALVATVPAFADGVNLLNNGGFEKSGATSTGALGWEISKAGVIAQVVPSTLPGGESSMLHVTTSVFGGVDQVFGDYNSGPMEGFSSVWVYLVSGGLGFGTGNGGNTSIDKWNFTTGVWIYLTADFGTIPVNNFIVYGTSGSEFYLDNAVVDPPSLDIAETPEPASMILLAVGFAAMRAARRRVR